LTPTFEPVGSLVKGRNGVLALTVTNAGPADSGPLTAKVALPAGITAGDVSGTGWSNGPAANAATHPHPAAAGATNTDGPSTTTLSGPSVPDGGSTTAYLSVTVSTSAVVGDKVSVSVSGTGVGAGSTGTATSMAGVEEAGLGAEIVTTDHAAVAATGNTLLSCAPPWLSCDAARHGFGDLLNDDWPMRPYDSDDDSQTAASSSAVLTVPDGTQISWAGLYWSGLGSPDSASAMLGQHGSYTSVQSSRVEQQTLHGTKTYQAFADVTATVKSGGTWWAGLPDPPEGGYSSYAGWSLVVVVKGDSLPERRVAVFDGLSEAGVETPFDLGPSGAGPGQVTTVAWEGDAGLTGDQVDLDGVPLAPCDGACDMEHSSAEGAIPGEGGGGLKHPDQAGGDKTGGDKTGTDGTGGDRAGPEHCHWHWLECPGGAWNTFGTDVHTYPVQLDAKDDHKVSAATVNDLFLLGVVGVSLPPQ
jgi:hypothetical protein